MSCQWRWAILFSIVCMHGAAVIPALAKRISLHSNPLASLTSLGRESSVANLLTSSEFSRKLHRWKQEQPIQATRTLAADSSSNKNGTETGGVGTSAEHLSKNWPKFKFDLGNGIAIGVSILGASLANAAGVGGGGMFVPMFAMLGFDTKTATALSQATITGGAVTSFLFNIRLQHPTQRRPLIDYDIALLLEPMLLFGISIGVVFNIVFPAWLIVVLLTVLLLYMAWRTTAKGISTWRNESRKAAERRVSQMAVVRDGDACAEHSETEEPAWEDGERERRVEPASEDVTMADVHSPSAEDRPTNAPFLQKATAEQLQRLKALWMRETSIIPKWRLVEMLVIWVLFLWLQIFKGGRSSPSIVGVRSCSHWFWILVTLQLPLCAAFTAWEARRLWWERKALVANGTPYEAGDVQWRMRELLLYPVLALLAGILAGLLGIGGGMMIGPLLLEMGVLPQVTAATGALMVLFSSSMAVAQFSILHLVPLEQALIYGGICAVSGYFGLVAVRVAIAKYGRTSIIIFALAIVIWTSAAVSGISGGFKIHSDFEQHAFMGFQPLCPAKKVAG